MFDFRYRSFRHANSSWQINDRIAGMPDSVLGVTVGKEAVTPEVLVDRASPILA
jgi:hypothetical protein